MPAHKSDDPRSPSARPPIRRHPPTPKTGPKTRPARHRRVSADRAEPVHADLIVIAHPSDKLLGARFRLAPGRPLVIGRSADAEVSLFDVSSVSRHHARLHYAEGAVILEDLGSTNGTFVDDRAIRGQYTLKSGDRFQVGSVHFKLLHELDVEAAYHRAVYDLMTRDGLTEAWNKRTFEAEVARECLRARRYDRPLSLILFDLDHFKEINDARGHLCGDMVLKKIAALAKSILRAEQILARVGGEEFAVLCPETPLAGATILAERLREATEQYDHTYANETLHVTSSFGVAQIPAEGGWTEFFAAADAALYASKREGRNRVTVAPIS
jgi:two-component system cell cycle response regulator